MLTISFYKAQALENDFVIFEDCEKQYFSPSLIQKIAHRKRGIGCDQVIIYKKNSTSEYTVRFYNRDGGEVSSCGNGSRALAKILFEQRKKPLKQFLTFYTKGGVLKARELFDSQDIEVTMPPPCFEWKDIPQKTEGFNDLPLQKNQLCPYATVNVGNPHLVVFVQDIKDIDFDRVGLFLSTHPLFPEGINVSFAQKLEKNRIRIKVWERGSGFTGACGTAACATAVLSIKHQITPLHRLTIEQPGGCLTIEWLKTQYILMSGSASITFQGDINLCL